MVFLRLFHMHLLISALILGIISLGCQSAGSPTPSIEQQERPAIVKDTVAAAVYLAPYDELEFKKKEVLTAASGTKAVMFNSTGTRLYAMNLEGMSVYEFDQATKKITREFKFTPTKGTGWDYAKSRPIASYQEKPVEACFSHNDRILWVSLHNAEGIVPIFVDEFDKAYRNPVPGMKTKPVTVIYPGSDRKDVFNVPLIETGKTPKVISRTSDSRHLLVSNWHSRNVSVLEMDAEKYPFGKVVSTVPVSAIPRGVVVDDKNERSFVAIMGGASLSVINNNTWKSDTIFNVAASPRHVVMDDKNRLFVSYNSLGTIAAIDANTGKTLFTAKTHAQPRTIVLSKNHKFIFVTCYTSDMVDVYKINEDNFTKVASLPCGGRPVGVDVFEGPETLEAWVCSYSSGSITVFTFKKK
jgi:DNA-binding beta-propeller fold protein YncE